MLESLSLGALQGVTEWLPVSSEGVVAVVDSFVFDRPLADAIAFALWLHLGTAVSAAVVFRREFIAIIRVIRASGPETTPTARFFVVATLVSGLVGFPLLVGAAELSGALGNGAMAVVGVAMLATAAIQLRRPLPGMRTRETLTVRDAAIVGIVQGIAVLPGVSRSGATVVALLIRGVERREALVMSFVLSVPASLGAAAYVGLTSAVTITSEALLSAFVAGAIGVATIRAFLAVASRVNFAAFVGLMGLAIIAGVVAQTVT
jgi:undecaprenyl-diphosphatase